MASRPSDPNWKPTRCADCGRPWPSFSRDGRDGPWRCGPCDAIATPQPDPAKKAQAPAPPQDRLL